MTKKAPIPGARYSDPHATRVTPAAAKDAQAPATLRSIPPLDIDKAAYRQAIADQLHDPFNKGLVELFWHGTDDYQRFIARDGLEAQQKFLAQIRHNQAHYAGLGRDLKALPVTTVKALENSGADRETAEAFLRLHGKADYFLQQARTLEQANERLTVALMTYLERTGDAPASVQPIINVNVEPTPIEMEAIINVSPAEVAVQLPPRHSITHIERNLAGEIVKAEQFEKSI